MYTLNKFFIIILCVATGLAIVSNLSANQFSEYVGNEKDLIIEVYTGGAPWDPQINFIYNNGEIEFSYEYERTGDNGIYRKEIRVERRKLDREERLSLLNVVDEVKFWSLKDKYTDPDISGGVKVIVDISKKGKKKKVALENTYVDAIYKLVKKINKMAPEDIRLDLPGGTTGRE